MVFGCIVPEDAEVERLRERLALRRQELADTDEHLAKVQELNRGLSERVAAQAELLGKNAERNGTTHGS